MSKNKKKKIKKKLKKQSELLEQQMLHLQEQDTVCNNFSFCCKSIAGIVGFCLVLVKA